MSAVRETGHNTEQAKESSPTEDTPTPAPQGLVYLVLLMGLSKQKLN